MPLLSTMHRPAPQYTSPLRSFAQSADEMAGIKNTIASSQPPTTMIEELPSAIMVQTPWTITNNPAQGDARESYDIRGT